MKLLLKHGGESNRDDVVASFFFNARSSTVLPKSAKGMYRSLLCQILKQLPQLEPCVADQFEGPKREHWPVEMLENAFRDVIKDLGQSLRATCYIDALDECYDREVRRAVACFEDIAKTAESAGTLFWICLSSRYYPRIKMQRHSELLLDRQQEHLDISHYVQDKLSIEEPSKQALGSEIQQRCSGVFLWVVLVVEMINEEHDKGSNLSQLRASLRAVPHELSDLFARSLRRADDMLIVALQWVLFSRTRLSLIELYFAILTGVGDLRSALWKQHHGDIERMKRYIVHRSRGLIEIVETPFEAVGWVQFIHKSVRGVILILGLEGIDQSSVQQMEAKSHAKLFECCQPYMNLGILEYCGLSEDSSFGDVLSYRSQSVRDLDELFPLVNYAVTHALDHLEMAFKGSAIALDALERFPLKTSILLRTLHEEPMDRDARHSGNASVNLGR